MSFAQNHEKRYTAVAFAGSASAYCDEMVLFVSYDGDVYQLDSDGIGEKMTLEEYRFYVNDGACTPFDEENQPDVEKGFLAFYLQSKMYDAIKDAPRTIASSNIKEVDISSRNLKIFLGDKKSINNLRKAWCQRLLVRFKRKARNYLSNQLIMNEDQEVEDLRVMKELTFYGMALAGSRSHPGLFLDFAYPYGIVQKWIGDISLMERNYNTNIRLVSRKISIEEYKKEILNREQSIQQEIMSLTRSGSENEGINEIPSPGQSAENRADDASRESSRVTKFRRKSGQLIPSLSSKVTLH